MREMEKAKDDERTLAECAARNQIPCDERHYTRFLRKIFPGPDRAKGACICDTCGMRFDEDGVPMKST